MTLLDQLFNLAGYLAAFCVAIGIIVFVHEFGHYFAARCCGVVARVFSIGIGPTLIEREDRNGTSWRISLLPLGGYVSFPSETTILGQARVQDSAREGPDSFLGGVSLPRRFMIILAGPIANFILAICLFAGIFTWNGQTRIPITIDHLHPLPGSAYGLEAGDEIIDINGHPITSVLDLYLYDEIAEPDDVHRYRVERGSIEEVVSGPFPTPAIVGSISLRSAAEAAGILPGDVILSVDGKPVESFQEVRESVLGSEGRQMMLGIWRDGDRMEIPLAGRMQDIPIGSGEYTRQVMIGITQGLAFETATDTPGPILALYWGMIRTWTIISGTFEGISGIIARQISSCNMQGVVGIAQVTGSAASQGLDVFIMLIAVLSVAVGTLNLLPVPVLDGGYIVFYLYEALTGRTPAEGFMRWAFAIGASLVVALLIFTLYQDIVSCPR